MRIKRTTVRMHRAKTAFKWFLYFLLAAVSYIFMTVADYSLAKPLLLIPLAICIATHEDIMLSCVVGVVSGFMLDSAMGKLFGYNAVLMLAVCMFTSLLFMYLMRQNVVNIIWITAVAALLQGSLDFLFYYAMWGHENVSMIFTGTFLPSILFTVLSSPVIYFIIKFIYKKLGPEQRNYIEEKSENIVRE